MSESQVEYGTYAGFLSDVKTRLKTARIRAHLSANSELLELYWDVRQTIEHGWRATLRRSHFRRMLLFWGRSLCWIQWCQLLAPTERRPPLLVRNREYAAI